MRLRTVGVWTRSRVFTIGLLAGCVVSAGGCATIDLSIFSSEPAPSASTETGPAHGKLGIPPGHLPAPGQCRIWYPGRPPGQQPPPGDCAELERRVPAGAWLIRRPTRDKEYVQIHDYSKAGARASVRVYDASSGVYVGVSIP